MLLIYPSSLEDWDYENILKFKFSGEQKFWAHFTALIYLDFVVKIYLAPTGHIINLYVIMALVLGIGFGILSTS